MEYVASTVVRQYLSNEVKFFEFMCKNDEGLGILTYLKFVLLYFTVYFNLISYYRQNCLSSLQKDSSVINLYNVQQTVVSNEEIDPSVMERVITPGSPHNITSFSWHNFEENRLLTIALSGTFFWKISFAIFNFEVIYN